MAEHLTPVRRAEIVAARQEGALGHDQAVGSGLSDAQIFRVVRSGRWRRAVQGVYCVAGAPDSIRQRVMVAYLATRRAGGVVSHLSAAAEWNLMSPSPLPHVTVPPTASAACKGAKVHRSAVPAIDRAHRRGMLVTSVSRTLVDLASLLDRIAFEEAVDVALCRKQASVDSVTAALDRTGNGRRGKTMARDVLQVWTPLIEPGSPGEVRLLRRSAEEGIVGLVAQYDVFDEAGEFVARLDLAEPEHRRGFEYDGVEFHGPRRWTRDEARYARLRALGWLIEPITKLDLLPGEPRLREIAARWGLGVAA